MQFCKFAVLWGEQQEPSSQRGTPTESSYPLNQTMHHHTAIRMCQQLIACVILLYSGPGIKWVSCISVHLKISVQNKAEYQFVTARQTKEYRSFIGCCRDYRHVYTDAAVGLARETAEPNGTEPCAKGGHTGISLQARWISSNAPGFTDPLKTAEEVAPAKMAPKSTQENGHPHTNCMQQAEANVHGREGRKATNPEHARRPEHARHQNHEREGRNRHRSHTTKESGEAKHTRHRQSSKTRVPKHTADV